MKLVAKQIDYTVDSKGNLIVSLHIPRDMFQNQRIARKIVEEMKDKTIEANIKELKSQRSLDQNEMLWAVIKLISDEMNGSHREEDLMRVYKSLLMEANIKRDYMRGIKEAVSHFEDIEGVRAVSIVPNSEKTLNGQITVGFWVYWGSSKFTTKEMTELIDLALDKCAELGIDYERENI